MKRALFFETTTRDRDGDLCRMAEALWLSGFRVLIFVDSTMEATHFDDLLWTFNKESFVPHKIINSGENIEECLERVFIGVEKGIFSKVDAVVLAANPDPEELLDASVVAIPVLMDDDKKRQESRSLWKRLQSLGVSMHHLRAADKKEWPDKIRRLSG